MYSEKIDEIKRCAECAIYGMKDHKVVWLPEDGDLNEIVEKMQEPKTIEELRGIYYQYMVRCIELGYSDGEIIAGIMQNKEKNEELDVKIEPVILTLMLMRESYSFEKSREPKQEEKLEETRASENDFIKDCCAGVFFRITEFVELKEGVNDEIWERIKKETREKYNLSDISYMTWIAPLKFGGVQGNTVVAIYLGGSTGAGNYLNAKFKEILKSAIEDVTGRTYEVLIR